MTESPNQAADETTAPAVDTHLEILLRLVEAQPDARMAICLTTPGGIIGGHLVAARSWAERWEDAVRESGVTQQAAPMAQLPQMVQAAQPHGDASDRGLHRFLHLVDVTFMSVPGAPTSPVWRGRVSDICGWSLGAPS
ncbi:hypothetical protein [Streptomyces sp.]|uniref:hypothetical protein n=1 Tax=Streptomyces sp. TaxID=1931 RepID=UPI002D22FBC5|nr:hypothetical protein [Streptomyces sp.]HZF91473.1 hypothetical protein [Streptomyces sp.]